MHRPRSAGASGDQSGRPIEQYEHPDKQRPNNPSVGLVSGENDPVTAKGTYAFDPHLDPSLEWAGKAEHTSFEIPTVSLHVHERIDPRTIVEAVQRTGDLEALGRKYRYQKIFFEAARDVFDQMRPSWKGTPEALLGQVIPLVERFVASDRISIHPPLFNLDDLRRRIIITLNMSRVVQHVFTAIRPQNSERLIPVFDTEHPIGSSGDMRPWYTRRACSHTAKSQINLCVYDSTWEATEAFRLDKSDLVEAWVKNDHLGFEIFYFWNGSVRRYRPDFLVKLTNSTTLVVEVKGQDSPEQQAKRKALDEWVRAVNGDGRFGRWAWDIARQPGDVSAILAKHG